MKVYTIIGGVNGTGKSSLTGVLKTQTTELGVIIDVDRITALAGVSPIQGGTIALERISDCLSKHISFTQETTLSGMMIVFLKLLSRGNVRYGLLSTAKGKR